MGSPSWHTIDLDVGFSEVKVGFFLLKVKIMLGAHAYLKFMISIGNIAITLGWWPDSQWQIQLKI